MPKPINLVTEFLENIYPELCVGSPLSDAKKSLFYEISTHPDLTDSYRYDIKILAYHPMDDVHSTLAALYRYGQQI